MHTDNRKGYIKVRDEVKILLKICKMRNCKSFVKTNGKIRKLR